MSRPPDPSDIRNWQRRPDGITTSGRLERDDLGRLAEIGIRHVVNLALDAHPEALAEEKSLLAERGIGYTHIPVPFDAPTKAHLDTLRTALSCVGRPVHVHCIMNYRVTAFMYLLDREAGVSEEEARRRMQEVWDPLESEEPAAQPWKELLKSL